MTDLLFISLSISSNNRPRSSLKTNVFNSKLFVAPAFRLTAGAVHPYSYHDRGHFLFIADEYEDPKKLKNDGTFIPPH
jgi:hypothetical protein